MENDKNYIQVEQKLNNLNCCNARKYINVVQLWFLKLNKFNSFRYNELKYMFKMKFNFSYLYKEFKSKTKQYTNILNNIISNIVFYLEQVEHKQINLYTTKKYFVKEGCFCS